MLNYETILSSYDDKMTLMQWLKKVEEALKHASATAFRVSKKGNATISFILDFEDGTTLESGDIVLQQGESVNGAYIENNHLFITLTNGQVIDAGLMFNGDLTINGTLDATKVTGNEIVENMSGYNFEDAHISGVNFTYAGVVKNGNKITFALAGNFLKNENTPYNAQIGQFICPSSIMNKIYPLINGKTQVDVKDLVFLKESDITGTPIKKTCQFSKIENYGLMLQIVGLGASDMPNEPLIFRYETTFLLSPNLAGN